MYNSVTEEVIRSAPQIDGSETQDLPQYLTKIYARIVTVRRRLDGSRIISNQLREDIEELRKLANNLETLTVLNKNNANHVPAAFVAGTANHLLQLIRDQDKNPFGYLLEAQNVPNWISSVLLFLIGESPADAAEIAGKIPLSEGNTIKRQLSDAIVFLATGQLGRLRALELITGNFELGEEDLEAEDYLWRQLLLGLQQMAEVLLGMAKVTADFFGEVSRLAVYDQFEEVGVKSCYAGPYHLSMLLDILQARLLSRGVINVEPPTGIDEARWFSFIRTLATSRPYLWENHFEAISTGFLNQGNSAVLTFPTGAGKTKVAELKIASTVMSERSVLYLVPTHALEDQINRDLTRLFDNMNSDLLEIGAEFTSIGEESLSTINVMTPERCLTLLAMNPGLFNEIGLVVFDEFHLVNGREDGLDKRSLDAMYCLVRLFTEIPDADYLLISAMVENAEEIATWVGKVTGRNCEAFNSNWKPTRQLQGCVIYPSEEIDELQNKILAARRMKPKGDLGRAFKRGLTATPYQIFSLRNKWDSRKPDDFFIRKLFDRKVELGINIYSRLTSNRNLVAAELAAYFVNAGIKTLVFVNNPVVAKSTAKNLNALLESRSLDKEAFTANHARRIRGLEMELGDSKYSFFNMDKLVAAHHGLLLPVERQLNESLFKTKEGIHAIVATATLAQGINLPAEVVIIAGDDRFDEDTETQQSLQAHEILNAAGRAGRAGSAAQGVVLIIPGKVISFEKRSKAPSDWVKLQRQIFSKSDQCLEIKDPLSKFLDAATFNNATENLSQQANSLLLRLHNDVTSSSAVKNIFNKSFGAFKASAAGDFSFEQKVDELVRRRDTLSVELVHPNWVEVVSLKTGIDPEIIWQLGLSLSEVDVDELFVYSLSDWIGWFLNWLNHSERRISEMFPSLAAQAQLARALGFKVTQYKLKDLMVKIKELKPILVAYVKGANYKTINDLLPGKNDDYLTAARHFILRLIPQFSFAIGAVSLTLKEVHLSTGNDVEDIPFVVKHMATMIREGLNLQEKLQYKLEKRHLLRVEVHDALDFIE